MTIVGNVNSLLKLGNFVNNRIFGRHNLLLTNAIISTGMSTFGDFVLQNYDILSTKLNQDKNANEKANFNYGRSLHMSATGLTTGCLTHYWYIYLDKFMGKERTLKLVFKKILVDQIFFSPVNLVCYFVTIGVLERSNLRYILEEIKQKGMENIYLVEWAIWPPAQFINFALIPLRYRILFDNVISFFFDIYSPYVKYKTELKGQLDHKDVNVSDVKSKSVDKRETDGNDAYKNVLKNNLLKH